MQNTSKYSYESDGNVPEFDAGRVFVVMDAHCSLCAKGASWIAKYDSAEEFRIVPLQSELGQALMKHYGLNPSDPDSWLFVEDGLAYTSLDAFVRTGVRLGGIWRILAVLRVLPVSVQNVLYRLIARNRYRLFGRADLCSQPNPAVRKRLVL